MADQTGANNPNWKGGLVVGVCQWCGGETRAKPSHAAKGAGKFCSKSCAAKYRGVQNAERFRQARVVKHCAVCGAEIRVKPSHVESEGTYCSRSCMAQGYRQTLRGDNNPNYRHGRAHIHSTYRESNRAWRNANRNKIRVLNAQAKARRLRVPGKYTHKDIAYLMRQQRGACVLCGCSLSDGYHVDHRIPVARGGSNFVGNLQLLCPGCNMRKHTRFMVELRHRDRSIER